MIKYYKNKLASASTFLSSTRSLLLSFDHRFGHFLEFLALSALGESDVSTKVLLGLCLCALSFAYNSTTFFLH